jgi:glycerol-3-phosphate dehydrogenase
LASPEQQSDATPSPARAPDWRAHTIRALSADVLDVLVIGGGIVGAGVARDAAMRGLRVGLVEQYDFASGTSSRTSRMLHGGLRYLAQGRIGLVRQAGREKAILARIAPHLSRPVPFVFPIYAGNGSDWPLWQMKIGVKLYQWLAGAGTGQGSGLDADELVARVPGIRREALKGGIEYFDSLTNDARLVIDTLRSAERHGATVVNYAKLKGVRRETGECRCDVDLNYPEDSSQQPNPFDTLTIRARSVVNASGPWSDQLPDSGIHLRLTKGVHLVVRAERLPIAERAVVLAQGNRIVFCIPWGERVIIGTTDTDYAGAPESVRAEPQDIDYLLALVNQHFPAAKLTPDDVISDWAGVRPLIASPGDHGKPSDISRRHVIRLDGERRWIDVAGGKLTTYRAMAEETVDAVGGVLGTTLPRSRTADEPLVDNADASRIVPPEPSQPLVEHYVRNEWAVCADDIMRRRTGWQSYYPRDTSHSLALRVADWMKLPAS